MEQALPYITGTTSIGLLVLWFWFYKWKRTLHDDIVVPDIALIKEQQKRQDARLDKLEKRCDDLNISLDEKIDMIVKQQIEITRELAVVSGKLELIVKNLTK
jgi:hypothetical protein